MTTADAEISIHSSQACFANEKQKLIPGRLHEEHLFLLAKINFTSEQFSGKIFISAAKKVMLLSKMFLRRQIYVNSSTKCNREQQMACKWSRTLVNFADMKCMQ